MNEVATIDPVEKLAPALPASAEPMALVTMAVQNNAGIEYLERLLSLQERWEASEARKAFDAAMAEFKSEVPRITKDARVSYTNKNKQLVEYDHATLSGICQAINGPLGKAGLSYSWRTKQEGGLITVECVITHRQGHSITTSLDSVPDGSGSKNAIQSVGSTITYLQRYTLLAALGLSTEGDDDDGKASGPDGEAPAEHEPAAQEPAELPPYAANSFESNLPKWRDLINAGKKTPEAIIRSLESRATLTNAQRSQIQSCAQTGGNTQ